MMTSTGEQTNAVFGFARMLLDVLNNQKPDYAIVALDSGQTFRHDEVYDGYKATAAAMPDDLRAQIPRVEELIARSIICRWNRARATKRTTSSAVSPGSARHELGLHVLIVTGDSDLLQLADDYVDVVFPVGPRFQDLRFFDRDGVVERYGFAPELIPDYKALVGDTSDNIPGVPGIGEKTAKALIKTWGDSKRIIAHIEEITPLRARKTPFRRISTSCG